MAITTKRITVDELNNYGRQIVAVRDELAGAQASLEFAIRDNKEVYEEYSKVDILQEARDRNIKIDGKPASASHRKAVLATAVRESINNRIAEHEGRVQRLTEYLTRLQSERDALQAEEIKQHEVAMQEYEARKSAKPEPTADTITPEQMAALLPFAQEYREHKQADRATFEAESALETVPTQVQEEPYTLTCAVCSYQETRDKNKTYSGIPRHCNKVMKVDFSEWESTPKQPKTFILREEAHPLKANATIYRAYHQNNDGSVGQPCYIGAESVEEAEKRLRASEVVSDIVIMPIQRQEVVQQAQGHGHLYASTNQVMTFIPQQQQEEVQHMEKQETQEWIITYDES